MKRGISLIAVLMFMLAATTAGVVVYKWIGSENFASGSRLKQSEAYQASEAGLDAVYAWLSYKAPDVGAVVKNFYSTANNKKAYELTNNNNNVLGNLNNNPNNIYYRVYLTGIDTSNKSKIKLKFQSIGVGRDGSKVQQTAIYSVNGLYKLAFQGSQTKKTLCPDYDEDFWGNMGTVNEIESARAVVTQDVAIKNKGGQALNSIKIGSAAKPGYLVLDGNYYANHGIDVYGDVYSTGDFDFCSTGSLSNDNIRGNLYVEKEFHPKGAINITGDAYLKGGVNPNESINNGATGGTGGCAGQASGGVVSIGGNSTIQGNFKYWTNSGGGGLGFSVAKNLVMDAGTITLTRTAQNNTDSLAVYGNAYIKNALTGTIPSDGISKPVPFLGSKTTDTVCVPGNMTKITSSAPSYCSTAPSAACFKDNNNIQIRTKATNVQASCTPKSHWYADTLKHLKDKLSDDTLSCANPPIQFDTTIYDEAKKTNPSDWVHRKDKPGSCETTARCGWELSSYCGGNPKLMELAFPSYPPRDIGSDLQNCYNDTKNKPAERKWNEWLVVYVKDEPASTNQDIKQYASKWGGNPNPGTITSGKYIIIYELSACNLNGQQCYLYLPPTAKGVEVMLYLPNGFPGRIELAGTPKGKSCSKSNKCDDYNYFIFSDGDINQFDATDSRKLHGNIFMNKCAVMNHVNAQGNGFLTTESNSEFVKELMEQGVLCMYEEGGRNCAFPDSTGCKLPPSSIPPIYDNFFVPLSPRLRVDLESKYISKEKENSENKIEASVLVMPRILRFKKTDKPSITSLKDYYNFLYLNYPSNEPKPTFGPPDNCGSYNPAAPEDGIYECVFNNTKISPFFLQIHSGAISDDPPPGSSAVISSSSKSSSSKASSSSGGGGGGSSDSGYSLSSASYAPWCYVSGGCYDYAIPVPQYGCGGDRNSEATAAKFKYTSWQGNAASNGGYKRISPTDVKWNRSPPEPHKFGSEGAERDIYMYDIRCDGERLTFGTDGDFNGIKCGSVDAFSNCDYAPWCRVAQTCFTGTSIPFSAIEYGCGYGGEATITIDSSFRYTAANGGNLSSNNAWVGFTPTTTQTISARTNAYVYMFRINCDGNPIILGRMSNEKSGMLCEGSLTTGATTCPSSNSVSSSSRASSSSSAVPLSSAAACAYNASWCNGDYTKAQNVPAPPSNPTSGNCFFVRDISKMQGASLTVNGTVITPNNNSEFACGQSWAAGSAGNASCPSLLTAKKDGGYYVYVGSWISNFTYTSGSINCGSGGGSTPTVSSSSSAPSSNSSGPSITCAFSPRTYQVQEPIQIVISCSNGTRDKTNANFNITGISPMNSNNWRNSSGNNAALETYTTYYTSVGTSTITVSNVKCDNQVVNGEVSCGDITIVAASSSSGGGGGTCGAGSTFGNNTNPSVGDCLNLTNQCTTNNNLPLKIYNNTNNASTLSGTIYCSNGSSKSISCTSSTVALCESNACPAGTNGAWLSVTSKTGTPQMRSDCY